MDETIKRILCLDAASVACEGVSVSYPDLGAAIELVQDELDKIDFEKLIAPTFGEFLDKQKKAVNWLATSPAVFGN